MTMRCSWCRYAIDTPSGRLWCNLRRTNPVGICSRYEREPGADGRAMPPGAVETRHGPIRADSWHPASRPGTPC